jgi:copper chaperone CopZ
MIRRQFIQHLTLASTGASITAVATAQASQNKTVTYGVRGFSCPTCAVGLDTMLQQQKGVARSQSSYAHATTVIEFNPKLTSEESLKAFVEEMGFIAEAR